MHVLRANGSVDPVGSLTLRVIGAIRLSDVRWRIRKARKKYQGQLTKHFSAVSIPGVGCMFRNWAIWEGNWKRGIHRQTARSQKIWKRMPLMTRWSPLIPGQAIALTGGGGGGGRWQDPVFAAAENISVGQRSNLRLGR